MDTIEKTVLYGANTTDLARELLVQHIRSFKKELNDKEELSLSTQAYLVTRRAICELLLMPEQLILEQELSNTLDMSRTPVREALVRLETEGWIQIIPRRGFMVTPITQADFSQTFEVLRALDESAVALATQVIDEDELEYLDILIQEQIEALNAGNLHEWTHLDRKFHQFIVEIANNQRLKEVRSIQSDMVYRANLYTIKTRTKPKHSILEHKAIVAAMRTGESNSARILQRAHQERVGKEMVHALENINAKI